MELWNHWLMETPDEFAKAIGYNGRPVPYDLTGTTVPGRRRTVLIPGLGYTVDMPVFYYLEQAAILADSDVVLLRPRWRSDPAFREIPPLERGHWVADDIAAVLEAVASFAPGTSGGLTLIAKSLGTLGMAALIQRGSFDAIPDTRTVWLTPLRQDEVTQRVLRSTDIPSLLVIGTADPSFDQDAIDAAMKNPAIRTSIHPDADHSLDVPDDIDGSVATLRAVIADVRSFAFG